MSDDRAPDWTIPVMRAGYSARGIVYTILGGLTLAAAMRGGQTEGTQGALATLRDSGWGIALLWIIALGLLCYGVWREIAAYYDLEHRGDDEEGLAKRLGLVVTGIIHMGMAVAVAALAMGRGGSGGEDGAQDWTGKLMALPAGKWLVAIAAIAIAGAGVHYILKGWKKKYQRYIRVTEVSRKLSPVLRWGFVSYGIILVIIGVFLGIAALQSDPSEAKGFGDALAYIRDQSYGGFLLGLFGLGILGFAIENFVEARYRVVPGVRDAGNLETLASRAKAKARAAAS